MADRNSALYRQRMAQANRHQSGVGPEAMGGYQNQPSAPMSTPASQYGAPSPHTRPPAPRSVPVAAGRPAPMRGPGKMPATRVPGKSDPANRYSTMADQSSRRRELATAEDSTGSMSQMLDGVNRLVVGVVSIVALSSVFVLPKQLKVFWCVVMGLTFLVLSGFMLYREWMEMSKKDGEEKYAEWAGVLLYGLVMLYTGVMVGILFFMAWSLYSIANSKSNLARMDRAAMADYKSERRSERREYV